MMQPGVERLPDDRALDDVLPSILGCNGDGVIMISRMAAPNASTFPSEIVTCRLEPSGRELQLLFKYGSPEPDVCFGHRGGVSYEARVYRQLLDPLRASVPRFYGSHDDAGTGATWLVLGHLGECVNLTETEADEAMLVLAARWLGAFHAASVQRFSAGELSFLRRYDADYYAGWAHRTREFTSGRRPDASWLAPLCERFVSLAPEILGRRLTVVHGEFYPQNVLCRRRDVYPLDWESAAMAAGEIDLAMLTEKWPGPVVSRCELEYRRARWPAGAPDDFDEVLAAARVYVPLRWMGDRREWTNSVGASTYLERVREPARALGWLP
jgi:hypothetical protein